jgi:hypothetical protein
MEKQPTADHISTISASKFEYIYVYSPLRENGVAVGGGNALKAGG